MTALAGEGQKIFMVAIAALHPGKARVTVSFKSDITGVEREPQKKPEEVMPSLLKWAGLEVIQGISGQLALLRKIQIGEEY